MERKKRSRVSKGDEKQHREKVRDEESMDAEKSLYEILGMERTASQQEIKKAYYKLALHLHQIRNVGTSQRKVSDLQNVMSVLGDEEKQAIYDQTGCVDDVFSSEAAENLQQFFRSMFRKENLKQQRHTRNGQNEFLKLDYQLILWRRRKEQFDSIISPIISKCGGLATHEPTEEEFHRAQQEARKEAGQKAETLVSSLLQGSQFTILIN
uniref:J domain-containing protein n=1 Tax=Ananas comosus var. bracteatus TaxID=296719 RepID=A0A6V7QXK9_ANACO